ncbi:MAG: hypothetical protein NC311_06400 [Muribaculaceae bacterium]|nr:hypothetical protein [Muribaculaceae bacterium]
MENATMWAYEHLKPHYSVIPTGFSPNRGMRLNMELEAFDENAMPKKYDETVFSYGINMTVRFTELNAIAKRCVKLLIDEGKLKAVTPEMSIPIDADVMTKITTCCIENTHEERKLIVDTICEELYKTPMPYSGQMVSATIEKERQRTEAEAYIHENFLIKWGTALNSKGWSTMLSPFGYTNLNISRKFKHHDKTFDLEELGHRVISQVHTYIMNSKQYGPHYARLCYTLMHVSAGPDSFSVLAELNHVSAQITNAMRELDNFDDIIKRALNGENRVEEVSDEFNAYIDRIMFPNRPTVDAIDYMIRYFYPVWYGSVEAPCRCARTEIHVSFEPFGRDDRIIYSGNAYTYNGSTYSEYDLAKSVTALFFEQILNSDGLLAAFHNIKERYQWEFADNCTANAIANELTKISYSMREVVIPNMTRDFRIVSDQEYNILVEKLTRQIWL